MPSLYQRRAWCLERTLQSKIAFVGVARALATDLPTFTGCSSVRVLSWKGCEFGRQMSTAFADMVGADNGTMISLDVTEGGWLTTLLTQVLMSTTIACLTLGLLLLVTPQILKHYRKTLMVRNNMDIAIPWKEINKRKQLAATSNLEARFYHLPNWQ